MGGATFFLMGRYKHRAKGRAWSARALGLALLAALASGCFFPTATPPMRITAGVGVRSTAPQPHPDGSRPGIQGVGSHRLEIVPTQSMRTEEPRRYDLSLGYLFEHPLRSESGIDLHGLLLGGSWHVHEVPLRHLWMRLSLEGASQILFAPRPGAALIGVGVTTGVALEFYRFVDNPYSGGDSDSAYFGYAYGEGGVGLALLTDLRIIDDQAPVWMLSLGVRVRIPTSFGFVLFIPSFDD